jgi:riboflavin kinase / FMN adenylyltransferase
MKVLRHYRELGAAGRPIALTVGSFDGIHLGHRSLVDRALAEAAKMDGDAWVLTFERHPLKVLRPQKAPPLLTTTAHQVTLLGRTGVAGCVLQPFTRDFADTEPEEFLSGLCAAVTSLRTMIVGENWRFGHFAHGNTALLQRLAADRGLAALVLPAVIWNGAPISSTRIRQAIRHGRLADAAAMLGRPFSVLGRVVHGAKRGRQLGYPTANVFVVNEVRPPNGIYAAVAQVGDRRFGGAAYLGKTAEAHSPPGGVVAEIHLLDAELDLYDRDLEILFMERLRDDRRFESEADLKAQIGRDIEQVRAILDAAPRAPGV